jgi:hypothetical protein
MVNARKVSFVDQGSPNGSKAGQSSFKSRVTNWFQQLRSAYSGALNTTFEDLNEYSVLAALLIDSKNFCGDGSHFASLSTSDFAGDATRLQRFRPTERRQRGIESLGYSPLSPMKSSLFSKRLPHRSSPSQRAALRKPGFLIVDRREQPIPPLEG